MGSCRGLKLFSTSDDEFRDYLRLRASSSHAISAKPTITSPPHRSRRAFKLEGSRPSLGLLAATVSALLMILLKAHLSPPLLLPRSSFPVWQPQPHKFVFDSLPLKICGASLRDRGCLGT